MTPRDETTRLAEAILEFRLSSSREFPGGMFGETGWEFLLALFIADAHEEETTGGTIGERIGASDRAASRWLHYLSSEGLVDGDGDGDLGDPLVLSPAAIDRMERLLDHAKSLRRALLPDL